MPKYGYTKMFEQMLNHSNINILLNTDYKSVIDSINYKTLIYTGPIDTYYEYCYGKLPYRSIEFKFQTLNSEYYQPTGTVNYPVTQPYTRITEFKYLTGQKHHMTSIVFEFPKAEGEPYYPIPRTENLEIYSKYKALAANTKNTYFTGRLGTYKYYNMDQVVAQSLSLFNKLMHPKSQIELDEHKSFISA